MAKPVTKYAVQIREDEDIVKELNKAYHIANSGRKGPVLIDLPMNIQRGDVKNPVYDISLDEMGFGAACKSSMEATANSCGAAGVDMAMKPDDSGVLESAKMADCEISACAVSAADAIREALASGDKVTISKFGTFEVRERSAKECKNPRTGEPVQVAASKAPVFKASKNLKESVNV